MWYCRVAHCRFPATHLSVAHRCGTCGAYGHGQIECARGDVRPVPDVVTSVATPCDVTGCERPWSHTKEAHHCAHCGARGGCGCPTTCRVACPLCKVEDPAVDASCVVYTGSDCVVCLESGPCVIFGACRHAVVCAACVRRLAS